MRIAFVSLMAGSPWAASEVLWAAAARRALEEGHTVFVSTFHWSVCPADLKDLETRGAQLDLRPSRRWHRRSALLTRLQRTFKPLEEFRADVICVSQGGTYDVARSGSAAVLRSTLRKLNTPYVLLCHCEQPSPPRRNLERARRIFRNAAIVGMVAERVRRVSEVHLGISIANARIFHNPVNLERIERLPWPAPTDTLRLASVGRLEAVKNLGSLIEALSAPQWRDRDWTLHVYGAGPDRAMLEQQVQRASLQGRITLKGYVHDIGAIWSEHHALIMPSRFEGVPLAMVEAMLCGRAVVATDIGGIADWLEDGRSGFLIAKPQPEHIRTALERLWTHRDRLEELGRNAHEATLAKRDPDPAGTLLRWAAEAAREQRAATARTHTSVALENAKPMKQPESMEALPAPIPRIASNVRRPLVSVMIPTYEPQEYLIDAVVSVLSQDIGRDAMQIAIVDDSSVQSRARTLLEGVVPANRIEFYEHSDNLGLAGNWNRAISLAHGEFIHVLHQDDAVRAGFYAHLLQGMRTSPRVGMAFCRHVFVDENDEVERTAHRERWQAGILPHWLERIGIAQRIQCPAAVVRREAYETLGGFRADLRYALDWEMWVRIAANYDVWYEPKVLAQYRRHASTESARLEAAGSTTSDMIKAIEVLSTHLPQERRSKLQQRAYRRLVRSHSRRAAKLLRTGSPLLALKQIESARAASERLADDMAKRWMQTKLSKVETRAAVHCAQALRS